MDAILLSQLLLSKFIAEKVSYVVIKWSEGSKVEEENFTRNAVESCLIFVYLCDSKIPDLPGSRQSIEIKLLCCRSEQFAEQMNERKKFAILVETLSSASHLAKRKFTFILLC